MLELRLTKNTDTRCKVLCLGAHSDDIEIGCGGTVLRLLDTHRQLEFYWVVFSSGPRRKDESKKSASLFLKRAARKTVMVKDFRTSFFPFVGAEIKQFFEELKASVSPDVIFTHYRDDRHQDHRVISDLTWNTFRNHLILEYEIPKYDGDLGSPNCFVPLGASTCQRKVGYVLSVFRTQRERHWFTKEVFLGLMRLRGMEANSGSRYAEAFYSRKLLLR
jgi:LmbE family N-acetylglucosaminyl deacetylase